MSLGFLIIVSVSHLIRFSTKQSLRHPYFSELREAEIRAIKARQDHAISGMSSIRGSALVGSISGRQQLFGKVRMVLHAEHTHIHMSHVHWAPERIAIG